MYPSAHIPRWTTPLFLLSCLLAGQVLAQDAEVSPPLKHHPGHYVSLNKTDDREVMREVAQPGVRGVQIRYAWAELEPEQGDYDFSVIAADLAAAAGFGLQLVAFVEDKSFTRTRPTPAYLAGYTLQHGNNDGWVAKRWDPHVVARYSALIEAIGVRFDDHPHFEGIAVQESAMSLSRMTAAAHGYTPEAYRDALIEILLNARRAMPRSQVFWYMNFFPGRQDYIGDVARAVAPHRIAMGGPDVLPDREPLQRLAYPFYSEFAERMTLFASMQFDSYAHRRSRATGRSPYWTMEELFLFARDELHADYIFWNRKHWRRPPDSYDWTDALPVIRAYPHFGD